MIFEIHSPNEFFLFAILLLIPCIGYFLANIYTVINADKRSKIRTVAIIFTIISGINDTTEKIIGCKVFKNIKAMATTIHEFIQLSCKLLPYLSFSDLISFFNKSLYEKTSPSFSKIR